MQLPGYRTSAKPTEEKIVLLYKKPWWKIWNNSAFYVNNDKQKYRWHYIKKWCSGYDYRKSILYYTTTGVWVLLADIPYKLGNRSWVWEFHSETLKGLRACIVKRFDDDVDKAKGENETQSKADILQELEKLLEAREKKEKKQPDIWL